MADEDTKTEPTPEQGEQQLADENWNRYIYGRDRGHREYCALARKLDGFYLGGGRQWRKEDRDAVEDQDRPAFEINECLPAVNGAVGYQIQNRTEFTYTPVGEKGDAATANALSKIAKYYLRKNRFNWVKTQVFFDGAVQQRGYYDIRMVFDKNLLGDISIRDEDPMDIIPDPDARDYDPDNWADVIKTGWYTADEIEERYGKKRRKKVKEEDDPDTDFGEAEEDTPRAKFGGTEVTQEYDSYYTDGRIERYRVIERQYFKYELTKVLVQPRTGDIQVTDELTPDQLHKYQMDGWLPSKRFMRRVYWRVTTRNTVLHDGLSPYPFFTIVPYFFYFRRGQTIGMLDNAVDPQNIINKTISSATHIISSTANSGWTVEEESLTNITTEELESRGAETGLVLEFAKGATKPEKIQPNQVPTGVDRLLNVALVAIKEVTLPEAARGIDGPERSGIAIQSKQLAATQQLALPLDNLARSDEILSRRVLWFMQHFITEPRVYRITEIDPQTQKERTEELPVNQYDPQTGEFLNDLTTGEYDVATRQTPHSATFDQSQLEQVLAMRKEGIRIPDAFVVRYSTLADKSEILEAMQNAAKDPRANAEALNMEAEARERNAKALAAMVAAMRDAADTAASLAANPATAPMADALLRSAGFQDQSGAGMPVPPAGSPPVPPLDQPSAMSRSGATQ